MSHRLMSVDVPEYGKKEVKHILSDIKQFTNEEAKAASEVYVELASKNTISFRDLIKVQPCPGVSRHIHV
ncbi:MAG: hypothetical protein IPP74_08640 [Alphaproteobacteria bacterium]|nr:hypothetical protein [Alphaproteobacteria bacterium]